MGRDDEAADGNPDLEQSGDTESDPSESDDTGHDWASEGGATPEGPATDID